MCACLNANDPLKDMATVLDDCRRMGVVSVSNIGPSISYVDKDSEIYRVLTGAGITLANEIEMLRVAHERFSMITIGLAFDADDAVTIARDARPHILCFHAGTTRGGLRGYDKGSSIEDMAAETEAVYERVRAVHSDALLVAHGAAMETAADVQHVLDNTSGHRFFVVLDLSVTFSIGSLLSGHKLPYR